MSKLTPHKARANVQTVTQPVHIRMDSAPAGDVQRWDVASISNVERTPQGGLRVDAGLARTGILEYRQPDGSVVREYCPPEELFHADSLATLQSAPVTDRHPPVMVNPENFRTFNRGHVVEGSVRRDGDKVAAKVVIQDGGLIGAVERKDRRELSCGYVCRVDETPGTTPDGQPYHRIQRNRRYNHVAVVERGRAGSDVSLRLDSAGNMLPPAEGGGNDGGTPGGRILMKPTIRIDGQDWPLSTAEEVQAAVGAYNRHQAKMDADLAAARTERDKAAARADTAEASAKDLQVKLDAATDPVRLDARVAERTAILTKARTIIGPEVKDRPETRLDGVADLEVIKRALAKARPDLRLDGKSEDYIRATWDLLEVNTRTDADRVGDLRRAANPIPAPPGQAPEVRKDAETDPRNPNAEDARARMDARNKDAWREPLAMSKGTN